MQNKKGIEDSRITLLSGFFGNSLPYRLWQDWFSITGAPDGRMDFPDINLSFATYNLCNLEKAVSHLLICKMGDNNSTYFKGLL